MNESKRLAYATAVVETRVLEKRMIDRDLMEKLLQEQSPRGIEAALRTAGFRGITPGTLDKDNFDALLREALEGFAQEMLEIAPEPEVLDLLFLEHDIFNIKAILMHRAPVIRFESGLTHIPAGRAARYRLLAEGAEPEDAFFEALFAQALHLEKGAKAVQEMLDQRYFEALARVAAQSGAPLCLQYARAKIDFYNILSMLRLARMASAQSPTPGAGAM